MIIPIDITKKSYNIGDVVITIKSLNLTWCYITEGHECIIIDKRLNTNFFTLKDINSDFTFNTSSQNFTIKTDINTAISKYNNKIDKQKMVSFIVKNCPYKYEGIDNRDEYDACRLKTKSYMKSCIPSLECITHISNEKIKQDTFVLTYLRNMKINKIKK